MCAFVELNCSFFKTHRYITSYGFQQNLKMSYLIFLRSLLILCRLFPKRISARSSAAIEYA